MNTETTAPARKPCRPALDIARAVIRDLRRKADERAEKYPDAFEVPAAANAAKQLRHWRYCSENNGTFLAAAAIAVLGEDQAVTYYLKPASAGGVRGYAETRRLLRAAGLST